ncbi:imidazolonepropionase-like amidohydrolase [Christiangramia gaetbulicola]|uniref:Imidazolonepropionase-like amidohydrolase n=1 Tax=Christiangramia gaetbulicola TaxID=703340 RepID=A0A2T6AIN4_9FLAO|nr:amidohydrolase family protein [Christiangramia gaetbulicola]PTX43661.1 imidazolonepropionase-like amidohydrolase [Christiangramia gaetbulicola]
MKKFNIYLIMAILVISGNSFAQQTPAAKQSEPITIVGATAHLGNGEIIENSLIILEDGKIAEVIAKSLTKRQYPGKIINAEGKHVYPGIIAPNSTLGLVEIAAVKATQDEDEMGEMLPNIRSLIAYNAESKIVESMRPNGVLLGQIVPRGGRISGTSSIVQFDAWNWEDAVVKENDGLHINWPDSYQRGRWWRGEDPDLKANKEYQEDVQELSDFFISAKAYLEGKRDYKNLPYLAMETVFSGDKKVFVHVDGEKEILDVVQFKKEHGLKNVVIVGGYYALDVAETLKNNDIPVLVTRPHSTPEEDYEDYDYPYKLANLLNEKGVLVAIEGSGQMERMNSRNLPFYAGTVAAYGMDKEEALKLVTLNTAKILGIDEHYGSLEKGKSATLFISEGDALDMRGNILSHAFIDGREVSLETHQTELWKRYSKKYKDQESE